MRLSPLAPASAGSTRAERQESTKRTRVTVLLTVLVVSLLGVLAACEDKKLPSAPSELTRGVTIYEHANFTGASALLTSEVRNLTDYTGPCQHDSYNPGTGTGGFTVTTFDWNDCMSSLKIAPGWRATVYRDEDFKGESLEVTSEVPNLQLVRGSCDHEGLNDCITSIRVRQQ